ncbi:Peroxidase 52 [Linum grandiflorum]
MSSTLQIHCQSSDLSAQFYAEKCPKALTAIHSTVQAAIAKDRRMAASLIRLQFHDCFVHGCDASVLLDPTGTASTQTEKTAIPNRRFTKTFQVIEDAKSSLERMCPGVVSCADIIAVAARDASAAVEGPTWNVKLGRRDSKKKKACPAEGGDRYLAPLDTVTPKSFDNNYFKTLMRKKGLLESDQVLYSGGSTDGIVEEYSKDAQKFSSDFAAAMVKMGDIGVITGNNGQIRKVCRKTN